MKTFKSFAPGTCQICRGAIRRDETCTWGTERGQRIHLACATVPEKESRAGRTWSPYQQAVFNEVGTRRNIVLDAVAGSGKTTTLEEFCCRLPNTLLVKYVVFGRDNATKAQEIMPDHVDASTFHSAGGRALGGKLKNSTFNKNKMRDLWKSMVANGLVTEREADDFGPTVQKLVGLAKAEGIGALSTVPDEPREWMHIIDHYGVDIDADLSQYRSDFDPEERAVEIARRLLAMSNGRIEEFDYDDMLYLTVRLHVPMPRYDVVCVDESQDTNAIQRAMLRMMLKPGGRLIAVGDPKQAIYGFRGATADAMDRLQHEFDCVRLPLSINYRCSKAVIEQAQQFCPELEAWDQAPEGEVVEMDTCKVTDFTPDDAVLCRVNAPLISLYYKCLAAGVPAQILGRDVAEALLNLIKRMKAGSLEHLDAKLIQYRDREVTRWTARGEEDKAQGIVDKVESIQAVMEALPEDERTIDHLLDHLNRLFVDKSVGRLTLSTVHKSKGLEWKRVFCLDRDRMPSKWARQPWQREQEYNLIYVMMTRAMHTLAYIDSQEVQ